MLILTPEGIIAARDRFGRTPIAIGKDEDGYVLATESHSYVNMDYKTDRWIGPGEIVKVTPDGYTQLLAPNKKCQMCSFMWIYYGYPAAAYDDIFVENMRYNGGYAMGKIDDVDVDYVAPIPDSGIGMAIGYSNGKQIPYVRSVVKYTPTWSRSFMPVTQEEREHVAKMKLITNASLLKDKKVVFCDDSIVRGTQLRDNVKMLYECGAKEVHIRISCPPLLYGCPFLNFSNSKTDMELITRRCIKELEGDAYKNLEYYSDHTTKQYANLVEMLRKHIGVDSLKFNTIDIIRDAIGVSKDEICMHCFDGSSYGH
jgi:amidophosphoribosyltransferase